LVHFTGDRRSQCTVQELDQLSRLREETRFSAAHLAERSAKGTLLQPDAKQEQLRLVRRPDCLLRFHRHGVAP